MTDHIVVPVETLTDQERAVNNWISAFCSGAIYASKDA